MLPGIAVARYLVVGSVPDRLLRLHRIGVATTKGGAVKARRYEVVYIFDSTLEEPEIDQRLERFHTLLRTEACPQPVTEVNHWGKRTLAYPIKRRETGYYVVVKFETEPEVLGEFERAIKLDEGVLRHLIVIDEGAMPAAIRVEEMVEEEEEELELDEDEEEEVISELPEESQG
jgi:small subunit ribosomal protein S6